MPLELVVASVALAALIAYALFGGADFGGGVWTLLARGPRAGEQREAIAHAMGPVWEANHVWLIFIIVLLFSCFPKAFALLSVALFVPLHLVLIGILLRGAAFVFHNHSGLAPGVESRWTHVFGAASGIVPVLLGLCLGAVTTGRVGDAGGAPRLDWTSPFAFSLGLLFLTVCAYLAAVYLLMETDGELREDFRRRALGTGAVMAAAALLALTVAQYDAPRLWAGLVHVRAFPLLAGAGAAAVGSAWAVASRRYHIARMLAAGQVTMLVVGWAASQQPYLVYPSLTLSSAAAPEATLLFVLWTLVPGMLLLLPSLALLFRVFKGSPWGDHP